MTGPKKLAANRANAKKSKGPTSRAGKERSSKNSRRHGLSIPIVADPNWSAEIEEAAREIAGAQATEVTLELAKLVAAAQLDLLRVRRARRHLITNALAQGADFEPPEQIAQRQRILSARLPAASTKRLLASVPKKPTGTLKEAMIVAGLGRELEKLERYERRALSRRKRAMRTYDVNLRASLKRRKSRYCVLEVI